MFDLNAMVGVDEMRRLPDGEFGVWVRGGVDGGVEIGRPDCFRKDYDGSDGGDKAGEFG